MIKSFCFFFSFFFLSFSFDFFLLFFFFFFNDTATTEIYTLSLQTLFRSAAQLANIPGFKEAFKVDKCGKTDGSKSSLFIVKSGGNGFEGVYNPPTEWVFNALEENIQLTSDEEEEILTTASPFVPTTKSNITIAPVRRRRAVRSRRSVVSAQVAEPSFNQVLKDPTVCLRFNEAIMFSVTNDKYPQYDEGNLYNTLPNFDAGEFKRNEEKHKLMGSNASLFSFRFDKHGVYVFKMHALSDKKLYIRVVADRKTHV